MRRKTIIALHIIIALFILIGPTLPARSVPTWPGAALRFPWFLAGARAEARNTISSRAGIAAWFQVATAIAAQDVRPLFRTVEFQTADYIIGSIPVPGYDVSEDVHAYISYDGSVLAYYIKGEPTSKIFDWNSGLTATKLEYALSLISNAAGLAHQSPTYYHFGYPTASQLLLASKKTDDGLQAFQVMLPSGADYFEFSWSFWSNAACGGCYPSPYSEFKIDGVSIKRYGNGGGHSYGFISPGQLSLDTPHNLSVETAWGKGDIGLAVIYNTGVISATHTDATRSLEFSIIPNILNQFASVYPHPIVMAASAAVPNSLEIQPFVIPNILQIYMPFVRR